MLSSPASKLLVVNSLFLSSLSGLSVIEECCQLGKSYSNCSSDFHVPIANVSAEHQDLCVATVEVCCLASKREAACERGQAEAKSGLACQSKDCDDNTFTECCIACKIGASMSGSDCGQTVNRMPSHYAQTSFANCCYGGSPSDTTTEDRCPPGFAFNARLNVCDDVDECYDNVHTCDPQFEKCVNTVGDYTCEPNVNSNLTENCPEGFAFYLISCIDVDECSENAHNCTQNQVCVNTEGSFECHEWEALDDDAPILCPRGYRLNPGTNQCIDINECATGAHNCNEDSQRCDNTLGSFVCVRYGLVGK